ncbi:hypothetical protein ACFO6R_02075 [Eubacterium multiforme]|uniref:DUF4825 domain-containing protein n=1 Tax=Eubacterium multiforme TaxID=83339 RepID=A0ABT9URP4_9FIRM|nr:hypothetical protein [Eubacterium multiforme]MDQ0148459.1 hypothetical protein [Eubacterium multiforme]
MKKFVAILIFILTLNTIFVGCGKYEPEELGKYNTIYKDKSDKEDDGSYPVINIKNIKKENGALVIEIEAPTIKQLDYAFDNFLFVQLIDKDGSRIQYEKMQLDPIEGDIQAELKLTGVDLNEIAYVEIGPYKTKDDSPLIFKVN